MTKFAIVLMAFSILTLWPETFGGSATAQEARVPAPRVIDIPKLGLKKRTQVNASSQLLKLGVGLGWESKACQDEVQKVEECVSQLGSNWVNHVEACYTTSSKYDQCNDLPATEGPVAAYDKAPVSRDLYCRQQNFTQDKCLDDLANAQDAFCQRRYLIPCFAKICGLGLPHCPAAE